MLREEFYKAFSDLKRAADRAQQAKTHMAEANLRLVVSVAKKLAAPPPRASATWSRSSAALSMNPNRASIRSRGSSTACPTCAR
jgi:hypothetical protein